VPQRFDERPGTRIVVGGQAGHGGSYVIIAAAQAVEPLIIGQGKSGRDMRAQHQEHQQATPPCAP
jgi:hypothetical protein